MSNYRSRHLTRRAFLAGAAPAVSVLLAACGSASATFAALGNDRSSTSTSSPAAPASADQPTTPASTPPLITAINNIAASLTSVSAPSTPPPEPTIESATAPPTPSPVHNAAPTSAPAIPSASQVLDRTFSSAALGKEMPYFIYLPVGYAESGLRYPVMYMLHGHGGENTEWIGYGLLETADKIINSGEIPPMLIVLPQGDQSFWVNHADDSQRWGDYTAQDVVQQIDATYRTIPDAAHRAIGGLSMGADGAMQLAMNYPGTFGVVGVHSPTLRDYQDTTSYVSFFGDEAYFNAHDPVHLAQQYPERARALKIWLDVAAGDTDWHASTTAYHNLLTQLTIPHAWHGDWPGIHDGYYWGGHAADYVCFYAAALAGV